MAPWRVSGAVDAPPADSVPCRKRIARDGGNGGQRNHFEAVEGRRNRNSRGNHGCEEMGEIGDQSSKRPIVTNPRAPGDLRLKADRSNQQSGEAAKAVVVLKFILFAFAL